MENEWMTRSSTMINANNVKVWDTLIDPISIKQFMFGAEVTSEWQMGSTIVWKGIWEGKSYEDNGVIQIFQPGQVLQYTHYAKPPQGAELPIDSHTITYTLTMEGDMTLVAVTQENNKSESEMDNSRILWEKMLAELKRLVEL